MKDTTSSEVDIISNLPQSIIDDILNRLPLWDIVRTSVLSREWRYKWLSCREIVFDFQFPKMYLSGHELEPLIYHILKSHQGQLLKFDLRAYGLRTSPSIDQWFGLLPSHYLQSLTLHVSRGLNHRLTSHFFTFGNLSTLNLFNCVFDIPSGFKGFTKLVTVDLHKCSLLPEMLEKFIALCPVVENLTLINCAKFDRLEIVGPKLKSFVFHGVFMSVAFENCPLLTDVKLLFLQLGYKGGRSSFDLVKSLSSLPALENLHLEASALEDLVEYGAPEKLPFALKALKSLHFCHMHFKKIEETSSAVCFIRSCPNLERLKIRAFTLDDVGSVTDFLRSQNRKRPLESLNYLKTVKMQLFSGFESQMEFVKYFLASAIALEEMAIAPIKGIVRDGGESIFNELKQYPRASARAEIVSLGEE